MMSAFVVRCLDCPELQASVKLQKKDGWPV